MNTYVFRPVRPVLSAGWRSRICASCGKRWNVHDRVLRNPLPCVCGAKEVPLTLGQALALTLARYCVQCEARPLEPCPIHDPDGRIVAVASGLSVPFALKNARAR